MEAMIAAWSEQMPSMPSGFGRMFYDFAGAGAQAVSDVAGAGARGASGAAVDAVGAAVKNLGYVPRILGPGTHEISRERMLELGLLGGSKQESRKDKR